jgi:hypothetical protein
MLDWYAAFALMAIQQTNHEAASKFAFDRAEAMMAERSKR